MDPDEALRELRQCVDRYRRMEESNEGVVASLETLHLLERTVDLFDDLDNWFVNGGFKPKDWRRKR